MICPETPPRKVDPNRLTLLKKIYRLHDAFIREFDMACKSGCSRCCTQNITATSLEVHLILNHWESSPESSGFGRIQTVPEGPRFKPRISLNQLADRCAKGLDIPLENTEPGAEACPLLEGDLCGIYGARPFGCRAMISRTDCAVTGEALMPDVVLTVNNVFLQHIEMLDAGGVQGNLIDVFHSLTAPQSPSPGMRQVIDNHPISVLMVPPEHRSRIHALLGTLSRIRDALFQS